MSFVVWQRYIHDRLRPLDYKQCGARTWARLSGACSHSLNSNNNNNNNNNNDDGNNYHNNNNIHLLPQYRRCPWVNKERGSAENENFGSHSHSSIPMEQDEHCCTNLGSSDYGTFMRNITCSCCLVWVITHFLCSHSAPPMSNLAHSATDPSFWNLSPFSNNNWLFPVIM